MTVIRIEDAEYEYDHLSEVAKARLGDVQFCDREHEYLRAQLAVIETARYAYFNALKEALGATPRIQPAPTAREHAFHVLPQPNTARAASPSDTAEKWKGFYSK